MIKSILFTTICLFTLVGCQPKAAENGEKPQGHHALEIGTELVAIAKSQNTNTVNIFLETQTSWVAGALNKPLKVEGSFLVADNEYYNLNNLKFFSIKADSTNTAKVINLYME